MHRGRKSLASAVAALALFAFAGTAQGAAIVKNTGSVSDIGAIASASTTGAEMSGMTVRATFSGGLDQTVAWATTGPDSGAAIGGGWSLSQSGDTFVGLWTFTRSSDLQQQLISLVLDGRPGFVTFDTADPNPGTTGSAAGLDLDILTDAALNAAATATYTEVIRIPPAAFAGDSFHVLTITFAAGVAIPQSFGFEQDTDNEARRFQAPEPGVLALLGVALAAAGFFRTRRKPH